MMRVPVSCAACDHEFSVSDELVGRRVKCPSCGDPVRVTDPNDFDEPPARAQRGGKSRKGSKKSQRSHGNGLAIGLGIGGGIVAVGLIAVVALLVLPSRQPQPVAANTTPAPLATPTATPPVPAAPSTPPAAAPAVAAPPLIAANPVETPAQPPVATTPAESPKPAPAADPPESETAAAESEPPGTNLAKSSSEVVLPKLKGVPAPSTEKLELPQLIQRVKPSVVRINVVSTEGASTGSGFVVSNDGTVVTNYHVITDATKAEVEFADGLTAKVLGYRHLVPKADIAILKIDVPSNKLKPVPISSELPLEGESVAAFGAPHGLSFTTSEGVISAIRDEKSLGTDMGLDMIGTWLQTTAPISPGNSGGPLLDKYGKVVGMNTMQLSVGQNLNFAVSALEINKALSEAPDKVRELKPGDLKPYERNATRKLASEEYDTERGRRLFAEVKEIVLISGANIRNFDPSGSMWERVITRSQKAVEKSGIHLSFDKPPPDVAILVVVLKMAPSRKGTDGTQDLSVTAELTCVDPLAKKNASPLAKVWKAERNIGTISLQAAALGKVPKSVDTNLTEFFGSFRSAYNKAVKANKEAKQSGTGK